MTSEVTNTGGDEVFQLDSNEISSSLSKNLASERTEIQDIQTTSSSQEEVEILDSCPKTRPEVTGVDLENEKEVLSKKIPPLLSELISQPNSNGSLELTKYCDNTKNASHESSSTDSYGGSQTTSEHLLLREWNPMLNLLTKIPQRAQNGLQTLDLKFTCVAAAGEYIALGTNVGLVYWYDRKNDRLDRFKTENKNSPITNISLLSTVDYMLAVGNHVGVVTIFQIPKPSAMNDHNSNRYEVRGLHNCSISALEWSTNGMKLFTGDVSGSVVLTDVDYELEQATSRSLLNVNFEIVQFSYAHKHLLVCSTFSATVYSIESNTMFKIGTQDRKSNGKFGGIFQKNSFRDLKLYSVRPGGRLWVANSDGIVEHTIKFKDLFLSNQFSSIPIINPSIAKQKYHDFQIGSLHRYLSSYLLSFYKNMIFILDPDNSQIKSVCQELKNIISVAVNSEEIFILESDRNLIRLSNQPDEYIQLYQNSTEDFIRGITGIPNIMSSSIADFRVDQSINYLTSKLKETSRVLPKINSSFLNTLKQVIEVDVNIQDGQFPSYPTSVIPLRPPDVPLVATEEQQFKTEEVVFTVPKDKFEHISNLPFDDDLLVSKSKMKKKRKPKRSNSKTTTIPSSVGGDTASLSSAYSINSDDDTNSKSRQMSSSSHSELLNSNVTSKSQNKTTAKLFPASMSQSWTACGNQYQHPPIISEISIPDLETKEEILARKLNWPELIPDSRRRNSDVDIKSTENFNITSNKDCAEIHDRYGKPNSETYQVTGQHLDNDKTVKDISDVYDLSNSLASTSTSTTLVNSSVSSGGGEIQVALSILSSQAETEELPSSNLDFEQSIDIYTKYTLRDDSQDELSDINFGPPTLSSGHSSSLPQPYIVEIHGSSLPSLVDDDDDKLRDFDVQPGLRDMDASPLIGMTNSNWVTYPAPPSIHQIMACNTHVICIDKRNHVYYSQLNQISLRWIQADYQASQISISICGSVLWRLYKGTLYSLMRHNFDDESNTVLNSSLVATGGNEWSKLMSNVISMSVMEHVGWVVKSNGSVHICCGLLASSVVPIFEEVLCPWQVVQLVTRGNLVWGVTNDGRLIYRNGVTENNVKGTSWSEKMLVSSCNSSAVVVAIGPLNTVWVGNAQNEVYFIDGISEDCYGGHSCQWKVSLGEFQSSSPGSLSTPNSGGDYSQPQQSQRGQFSFTSLKNRLTDSFRPEKLASLLAATPRPNLLMCATSTTVWYSSLGSNSINLNKISVEGHRWAPVKVNRPLRVTQWSKVFAGSVYMDNGCIWLTDPKGKLFCCTSSGSDMKAIDLPCSVPLVCIVSAPESLWVLNAEGVIYARCNISQSNPAGHEWLKIQLSPQEKFHFTHVSCGSDVAWACDNKGNIFMRTGSLRPTGPNDISPAWFPVEGSPTSSFKDCIFTKVFVGANGTMVWALDSLNNIYVREAIYPDFPIGTGWHLVSGIEATHLALSEKAVWALSSNGEIFRRSGITSTNFVGNYWTKTPGVILQTISASVCDELWGLDSDGQLLRHFQFTVPCNETQKRNKAKIVLDPEDRDWELVESL